MNYLMSQNPQMAKILNDMGAGMSGTPSPTLYTQDQVNDMVDKRIKELEQQRSYQVLMDIIGTIIPKGVQEEIVTNQGHANSLLRSSELRELNSLFNELWSKINVK